MRIRDIAIFLIPCLIWGSEWLATRNLNTPPLAGLAVRYAMAALLLAGVVAARGFRLPEPRRLTFSVITGMTFLALPAGLTFWAGQRVSSGLLVVILSMTPLIAALLEGRSEGVSLAPLLAPLLGGVGGTALLASQGLSFAVGQWPGAAAVLAAAGLIAWSVVTTRRELADVPVMTMGAIQLTTGAIGMGLASLAIEGRAALAWNGQLLGKEALLAVLGAAVALPLYYSAMRRMESFQLISSQWIVTVVGVAESLLLVGGRASWRIGAGAAILLASAWALLASRPGDEQPVTLRSTPPPS